MQDVDHSVIEAQGFELLGVVAENSRCVTWRAIQQSLNRVVFVRLLKPDAARHAESVALFLHHARILAKMKSPALPAVFDIVSEGDLHYIVLESCEGETLDALMRESGVVPVETALRIALDVSVGLSTLWESARVVHRNLKPENIFYSVIAGARISEFSLMVSAGPDVDATAHDEGMVVGTPSYLSPEQAMCSPLLTIRSDLYALGAVLYTLTTGVEPFSEKATPMEIVSAQVNEQLLPPDALLRDVPATFSWLLHKMMMKNPEDRYSTWQAFQADAQAILANEMPSCASDPSGAPSTISPAEIGEIVLPQKRRVVLSSSPQPSPEWEQYKAKNIQEEHTRQIRADRLKMECFLWLLLLLWFGGLFWFRTMPVAPLLHEESVPPRDRPFSQGEFTPARPPILEVEEKQTERTMTTASSGSERHVEKKATQVSPSPQKMEEPTPVSEADLSQEIFSQLAKDAAQKVDPIGAMVKTLSALPPSAPKRKERLAFLHHVPTALSLAIKELEKEVGKEIEWKTASGKVDVLQLISVTSKSLYVQRGGRSVELPFDRLPEAFIRRWLPKPTTPHVAMVICLAYMHDKSGEKIFFEAAEKVHLFTKVLHDARSLCE